MAEATLKLLLLGDDRSASRALRGTGDEADRTRRKFGMLAKAGALGLAAGAVVAGRALYNMGKAAAEDAQQQALLANALRRNTGATKSQIKETENWITAQGKAFGVADDKLRPALATLSRATKDVGQAQKLATIAMNVSAGTGKDLTAVSTALAKAQNGNVAALARLGVNVKDAEGKTISFEEAQKRLSKQFGGAAAASANTFAGKMGRLSLMFDEAKESIGAKLLPVAEKLANWFLRDGLPAITKFGEWFKKNLLPPLKELGEKVMSGLRTAFDNFKKGLQDARPALELYGKYFKNVLLPALKVAAEVIFPALGLVMRATGKALGAIGEAGRVMWNAVLAPVLRLMLGALEKVLNTAAGMLAALGKVPGMGWAKDAAKKLRNVADQAGAVKDNINDIPRYVPIKFDLIIGRNGLPPGDISNLINLMPQNQKAGRSFVPQPAAPMAQRTYSSTAGNRSAESVTVKVYTLDPATAGDYVVRALNARGINTGQIATV